MTEVINTTDALLVSPIPSDKKRGWNLTLNGEQVTDVETLEITNAGMGIKLSYGQRLEGFDGFIIREPNGGGSVTIPYFVDEKTGILFVGLIEENRAYGGGSVLNVPRGFAEPGETHFGAAVRELGEETGVQAFANRVEILPGDKLNPNSTFFVANPAKNEGVGLFAYRFNKSELEKSGEYSYRIAADVKPETKMGERIGKCTFVPIRQAALVADGFTMATITRLLLHLGRI